MNEEVIPPEIEEILNHMQTVKGRVETKELDFVVERLSRMTVKVNELEDEITQYNKIISKMKSILVGVLKDLNREDYKSPLGSISIKSLRQVRMPKTAEEKELLFNWMRERDIYDKYATVNARSLQSLFDAEFEAAARDQGEKFDPVLFSLPGIEPPTFFDNLKFTKKRGT